MSAPGPHSSDKRSTVSVSAAAYARFQAAAAKHGMGGVSELVEAACDNLPTDPAAVAALSDRVWANMPAGSRTARGG